MKLITAVIKPFKLDELRQAVADIGIQGVSCPAFAWPNSYSACLDDGVRPSGALDEVEFAAADRLPVAPVVFE